MFLYSEYQGRKWEKNITKRSDAAAKAEQDFSIFTCLAGLFFFPASDASPLAALVLHLVGLVVFAVVSSR